MDKTIGFIGSGNMANAIINGMLESKIAAPDNVFVYDVDISKVEILKTGLGINISPDLKELAAQSDIIFLAVKPHVVPVVLKEIAHELKPSHLIVSIAAGVTLNQMADYAGHDMKIIRVMPNTPAMVHAGMSSITPNSLVDQDELIVISQIFDGLGRAEVVPEHIIHAVTGISGSAPAYVFMFIEALADAGVLGGLPRQQAYQFAAQTVLGAAKMVIDTNQHPAVLKDMVCSPGGTTIEAVKTLEEKGFRSAIIDAVVDCIDKSRTLGQKH